MGSNIPAGPQSTDHNAEKNDLDVSQDSSGRPDPALDPAGPEKIPNNPKPNSTAKKNKYSPNFKSEPEPKPFHDSDIDTEGG